MTHHSWLYAKKKKRRDNVCTAILSMNTSTFTKMINAQRLRIGWSSCRVYEQVKVLRCFKCNDYGHKASDCSSDKFVCPLCAGEHKLEECQSDELRCVNCVKAREKLRIEVDVNHSTFSIKCPILAKKTQQRKQNIRYTA